MHNPDGIFTPGMFGRIRVPGSPPYTALLIPDAAIGSEQARKYVLVVDDGGMVRQKYVTPGQLDDGLRVVKDGLVATDRVIVNGLMHARPGIKVKAQEQSAPTPPGAPKAGDEAKAGKMPWARCTATRAVPPRGRGGSEVARRRPRLCVTRLSHSPSFTRRRSAAG